jgi:phosphopantothenoylcysteine decarboxylase/phosphopantothenate--cysteine ligase
VVNDVSGGKVFGRDTNEALVLGADGSTTPVPLGSKEQLAEIVWSLLSERLPAR